MFNSFEMFRLSEICPKLRELLVKRVTLCRGEGQAARHCSERKLSLWEVRAQGVKEPRQVARRWCWRGLDGGWHLGMWQM